jgi:Sap, sulfolipid-1-addressing protein
LAIAILYTLPLAFGIALNPLAIVTSILIANGANARRNGIAFVAGWVLGLAVLAFLPALLFLDRLEEMLFEFISQFYAALGILLLIAAAATLLMGPLPGEQPTSPRWADLLFRGGAERKLALGAFMSGVHFRNLVLLTATVSLLGQADLGTSELVVVIVVFVTAAMLGILAPLVVHKFGGEASEAMLATWATWLTRNVKVISGVIMALFGVLLLTQGVVGVDWASLF